MKIKGLLTLRLASQNILIQFFPDNISSYSIIWQLCSYVKHYNSLAQHSGIFDTITIEAEVFTDFS